MPKRQYIVYCDESAKRGRHFSNFYGGVVCAAEDQQGIESALREKKEELNLFREIKWSRITENYQDKYIQFIRTYFEYIATGRLKVRIMFTHNFHRPVNLSMEQHEKQYYLLYYQLIKHAFGFQYCNPNALDRVYIAVLLDDMPDKRENVETFKRYISSISETKSFYGSNVNFPKDSIADVDSKNHTILQGLDIILGAMHFRLNDLHREKPDGATRRGKRTIAKERVYKEINRLIRQMYPNFNVGTSTGTFRESDRWTLPYRHWRFIPREHERDESAVKRRAPPEPT